MEKSQMQSIKDSIILDDSIGRDLAPDALILFGPRARGNALADSDIDRLTVASFAE